jgi:hypothetical protein
MVEPKGGKHFIQTTDNRTKDDFVNFVEYLIENIYCNSNKIHIILENLNTHFKQSFDDILGIELK